MNGGLIKFEARKKRFIFTHLQNTWKKILLSMANGFCRTHSLILRRNTTPRVLRALSNERLTSRENLPRVPLPRTHMMMYTISSFHDTFKMITPQTPPAQRPSSASLPRLHTPVTSLVFRQPRPDHFAPRKRGDLPRPRQRRALCRGGALRRTLGQRACVSCEIRVRMVYERGEKRQRRKRTDESNTPNDIDTGVR